MFGLTRRLLAQWVADTITVVLLSTIATAPVELIFLGLSFEQTADARWRGAVVNILTGGLYGLFRNWIYFKKFEADKAGRVRQYFAELTAFGIVQVPFYALVLIITHADAEQVAKGCAFALLVSPIAAPVLDWCMVRLRQLFGVRRGSS